MRQSALSYSFRATRVGCLISLTLFLAVSRMQAQPLALYKVREVKKAFTIAGDGSQETAFFFPHAEEFGPLKKGYAIKAPGLIALSGKFSGVPTSETALFIRLYTRNISKVRFAGAGTGGEEKKPLEISVSKDGYQIPAFLKAEKLLPWLGDPAALRISYSLSDSSRPFTLVIGDLWIGEEHIADRLSPSDIFVHAPFANAARQTSWQWSPFDSYGECAYFPADQKEENFKGSIFIQDTTQTSNQLLSGILPSLLDHYPFYATRKVSKDSILRSASAFLHRNQNLPLCPFIDSINTFLWASLHDPHFSIRGACDNRKALRTPLYTYYLKGRYRIAGIFDDSLKSRVSLGTELLAVDGKVLDTARARDINGLLRRLPGERVNITVRHPDGRVEDLAWQVKDRYKIPATFSPGNLDMKFIGDSICYYRIGKINMELPLDFASRLDSVNTRKKLILDLRGNGGGDFLAGAQFLSYLIGRSYHYFDYEDVRTGKIDSVVIKANETPFHYRSDGKVVLLVDEATACIAELLVYTLRAQRNNVVVVGRESTRGALAFIYEINLPKDNVVIATNCLDTGRFLLGGRSIEEKGIAPDFRVVLEQVDDLQPYRDKVLTTAISK
ncbi:MAG: hypothetical protein JST68_18665 [Bacteroidetes bacterium]|nr:hypothetical protein [Bacteroidota bacterium]